MLIVSAITKSYGVRTLFSDVAFTIGARDRIAVVGPNGSGKTTLFRIIAGRELPDSGNVVVMKGTSIGYLEQETVSSSANLLLDDVTESSSGISNLAHKIQVLQDELEQETDEDNSRVLMGKLGELQHQFEFAGGYNLEHNAKVVLSGLGYAQSDFTRPLTDFSGGWRTRAALAKILLLAPDVLLLDEPTNHLDLESCIWFEHYLANYQGALMVISHDREFLNRVVGRVISIEPRRVVFHRGNYDSFVIASQKEAELAEAKAQRQDLQLQKDMRFVERFRAKKTKAAQVQSRLKRLATVEKIIVPRATRNIHFAFPAPARSGQVVVTLTHIQKSYGEKVVYRDLNLVLERGDKVALVGPNGAGKTTLLKMLAGVLPYENGELKLGHNVTTAYYAQYQLELLDPSNDVMTEMQRASPDEPQNTLRGMLGAFLFSGDDVFKKVSFLSGGEKSRLVIAKMLVRPASFLLMDEPTNHLDIASREMLTDALEAYSGTLCFITHDRTLIRQIANKIVEVRDGGLQVFPGNYDDYMDWKGSMVPSNPEVAPELNPVQATKNATREVLRERRKTEGELRNSFYRDSLQSRKRIAEIEAELAREESELRAIEERFGDSEHYDNGAKVVSMMERHRSLKESIGSLVEEWEALSIELQKTTSKFETALSSLEH
jgi:ATP-binding cassette subfamily F protein 3